MRFRQRSRKSSKFSLLLVSLFVMILLTIYFINSRLMPVYLDYAHVQTHKIASYVVSKAIDARTTKVLDINEIIEELPPGESEMIAVKFNTEIINRVRAETTTLVKEYLEQAENGDLSRLPNLENVEYDVGKMEAGDGIVFFVPLGQVLNLPIIGNLGPKIPIRFHIIGNVHSDVESSIEEFGINNARVEVYIHLEVNVQIIVPFASESATVEQNIPVAMGLVSGRVPHIYTNGGDGVQPSLEVPVPYE
ncbi:sporulation protein YunB [Lysinibacillus sp. 54212]|uniref:sporulation protein YunB n=1 Tax=Lysinibacillus sp. 54212 TaxID=3119829 RepID=UPI002FC68467